MKRSHLVLLLPLALAATVRADDKPAEKPAPNVVSVAVTSRTPKGEPTKAQMAQYGVCDTLHAWGFQVQSKVTTAWDSFLTKGGITVVAPADPAKKDDKKDEKKLPAPAFTVEGSIQMKPHKVKFYGNDVDVICFSAKVEVVLKDSAGKELKKIAFDNLTGLNKDAGEAKVLEKAEMLATRFLMREVFQTKEIADQIPQARQAEFKKFLEDEEAFYKENFDPTEKHKIGGDGDEKK